jgi:hypothetical protein
VGKVIARFQDADKAERALEDLKREGFDEKDVSLVAKDRRTGKVEQTHGAARQGGHHDTVWDGTAIGAGVGAGAGLLATAGLLVIPGIGPILALGPLAATLGMGAAGGLAGAFMDWGIPSQEGHRLQQDVERGEAVVLVDSPKSDRAADILKRHTQHVQVIH